MIKNRDPKTGKAHGGKLVKTKCKVCRKVITDYEYQQRKFCSVSCSAKAQPRTKKSASCHPQRPHKGLGLCKPCLAFKASLKRNYDLTTEQWNMLYELQGGLCPVCNHQLYKQGNELGRRAANVDHDHKTGKVRGLVCHICNRNRIGNNNLDTARRLVTYLEADIDGRTL